MLSACSKLSLFTQTVKRILLHYSPLGKIVSNEFNDITYFKYKRIDMYFRSSLKYAFCRICNAENVYYSFTGPGKRILLRNNILGACVIVYSNIKMLNYLIYYEMCLCR